MTASPVIKVIPASLTYKVRLPVLRPGRPPEQCHFHGDEDPTTIHLGLFVDDQLTGVASYMKTNSSYFQAASQYQLRGMAVLQEHSKKGFGAALLQEGEEILKQQTNPPLLWFNARNYAVGFYKKFGYRTIGEEFDIPGVCPHIVMYKNL